MTAVTTEGQGWPDRLATTIECEDCEGFGIDDRGRECERCEGDGVLFAAPVSGRGAAISATVPPTLSPSAISERSS